MQSKEEILKPLEETAQIIGIDFTVIIYNDALTAMDQYASQFQSPQPSKDVEAAALKEYPCQMDSVAINDEIIKYDYNEELREAYIKGATEWAEQAKEDKWEKAWNKLYEDFKQLDEYNVNLREENKRYKNEIDKIFEQAKEDKSV